MKVVAFAGGVGGAKLVDGLRYCLDPKDFSIIVNTGDDFVHFGLKICPDLDTICYTLANISNPETGWGRKEESWRVWEGIGELGGPTWFRLGDKDLATHLERTRLLSQGLSLSEITTKLCNLWGVQVKVYPMSDDPCSTIVFTKELGEIPFQEYFVKHQTKLTVESFRFNGIDSAMPAPGVLEAIFEADLIIFCPSNPWVSIDTILSVQGIRQSIIQKRIIAVSPIIAGHAVKGPAAKMFQDLGIVPSALRVADHYKELLWGFILDSADETDAAMINQWGIIPYVTRILMPNLSNRKRLAEEALQFAVSF